MLDILLQILSAVGILLLVLLGLLVVVVLLVLFFPVTYRVSGKKTLDELTVIAKANWLFGLLRLRGAFPEPGKMTLKLLWFTIYESGGDSSEQNTQAKEKKRRKRRAETETVPDEAEEKKVSDSDSVQDEKTEQKEAGKEPEAEPDAAEDTVSERPKEEDGSWISQKITKIQYTIRSIYDKIKGIWQNISYYRDLLNDAETRKLLSHVLFRLKKIIKSLRPRKLKAEILFGTGAPDTTGYAYGVYSMLMPVLGSSVIVTPDFQRAVLEGDFMASGFTTLAVLLWQIIQVVLDKRLKWFIDRLKREKTGDT